ncbi:MAG: hypothetical protein ACI9Y7_000144 [Dokdonia sp.]
MSQIFKILFNSKIIGMSDIKFTTNNEVVVETFGLKITGADLKMDYTPRRANSSPHRRAIVHDYTDGLTLNWANDYPGGISLNGDVKVSKLSGSHLRIHHHDVHLDNASRRSTTGGNRRAMVHDYDDGLTLNWANDYPGGVTIRGEVNCPQKLIVAGDDIHSLITSMASRLNILESKVAALEADS